jgi:hypothetical protein
MEVKRETNTHLIQENRNGTTIKVREERIEVRVI